MTNHEQVKQYITKCRLLGIECNLELRLEDNDEVVLVSVRDKEDTGKLVIPSFVTKIEGSKTNKDFRVPLMFCKYSEVYVDNRAGVKLSAKYLCAYMRSTSLKVEFSHPECVTSIYGLFECCSMAQHIDISGLYNMNVTNMSRLFNKCMVLKSIDMRGLDISKVKTLRGLFKDCYTLESIDMRGMDARRLESVEDIFSGCKSLKEVRLEGLKASKLKSMKRMFSGCSEIEEIELGSVDLSSVEDMSEALLGCINLRVVDIEKWNIKNVRNTRELFGYCRRLREVDLSNWDMSKLENTLYMFNSCYGLESVVIDISNVIKQQSMFYECNKLVKLDIVVDMGILDIGHWKYLLNNIKDSIKKINLKFSGNFDGDWMSYVEEANWFMGNKLVYTNGIYLEDVRGEFSSVDGELELIVGKM